MESRQENRKKESKGVKQQNKTRKDKEVKRQGKVNRYKEPNRWQGHCKPSGQRGIVVAGRLIIADESGRMNRMNTIISAFYSFVPQDLDGPSTNCAKQLMMMLLNIRLANEKNIIRQDQIPWEKVDPTFIMKTWLGWKWWAESVQLILQDFHWKSDKVEG